MSPTSVCFAVTKTEAGNLASVNSMQSSKLPPLGFQFGIHRRPQDSSNAKASTTAQCLKVSKESHRIRKPPLPLPPVQYRPPVIIHTYSPKVIHTQPDDFMSLVQKLTGSSDTRLRLKRSPGSSRKKQLDKKANKSKNGSTDIIDEEDTIVCNNGNNDANLSASGFNEDPEQQGSGSGITLTTNCGSPSSSEDSAFPGSYSSCSDPSMQKQSDSPRGPLSASCEFLNTDAFFSQFDASPSTANIFSHVKPEPGSPFGFPFGDTSSFNFFTDFTTPQHQLQPSSSSLNKAPKPLPRPPTSSSLHHNSNHHDVQQNSFGIDINSPLPSPGMLSPGLLAGLPELSPSATAPWSQSFLDCVTGPATHGISQPLRRQRFGGYSPADQSPMVSLECIQAFMLS